MTPPTHILYRIPPAPTPAHALKKLPHEKKLSHIPVKNPAVLVPEKKYALERDERERDEGRRNRGDNDALREAISSYLRYPHRTPDSSNQYLGLGGGRLFPPLESRPMWLSWGHVGIQVGQIVT